MSRAAIAIFVSAGLVFLANASAAAAGEATLRPSFRPNRPGARAALTLALTSTGGGEAGQEELPPPLSRVLLHLPAGLRIDLRGTDLCTPARLIARGAGGCPTSSLIGRGRGVMALRPAFTTISEEATLTAFATSGHRGSPAMAILSQGYTPLEQRSVFKVALERDARPYGLKLATTIPPMATLGDEPNASIMSLSLTIGSARGSAAVVIVEPRGCHSPGFPFAADLTFADGSSARARATATCP